MREKQNGFGIVEGLLILIIVGLIGFTGWYVWHSKQSADITYSSAASSASTPLSSGQKSADPYEGWKSISLTSEKLSFKYPADWTLSSASEADMNNTKTKTSDNIEVKSPTINGHYFSVDLTAAADVRDVNSNFLGTYPGITIVSLKATYKGKSLYVVANTQALKAGDTLGYGITTTPGSQSTSFGLDKSMTVSGNFVTMSANYTPVNPTLSDNGAEYPLETYSNNSDLIKIFESLNNK